MEFTYPKDERIWVQFFDNDKQLKYIITSKQTRDMYYIYELKDKKFIKLAKDKNPKALESKYVKF